MVLEWYIGEEVGDRLPVVISPDGFCEHHGYINALDLLALAHVHVLWDGVGHHYGLKTGCIDPVQCRAWNIVGKHQCQVSMVYLGTAHT